MGRHVKRVRHRGRDFGVAAGRRQPDFGERRVIVRVNDVVDDPRVLRQLLRQWVEDRGGLVLLCEGLVGGRRCRVERQRIEDRRLGIVRVTYVDLLHGFLIGLGASLVVDLVRFLVECVHGRDVVPFAFRLRARSLCFFYCSRSVFQIRRGRRCPQGMVVGHSHSPVGHAARGITLGDFREGLCRLFVPERMQHRHRAVERLGLHRIARRWEIYISQFLRTASTALLVGIGWDDSQHRTQQCHAENDAGGFYDLSGPHDLLLSRTRRNLPGRANGMREGNPRLSISPPISPFFQGSLMRLTNDRFILFRCSGKDIGFLFVWLFPSCVSREGLPLMGGCRKKIFGNR